MALAVMEAIAAFRSEDEELVAIVENDACGVDALQCITGCTFGKGNLIFRDFGKQVYTIFSRRTGRGVRVVFHGNGVPQELRSDRKAYVAFILSAPMDSILSVRNVNIDQPEAARIRNSVFCEGCMEPVMDTRIREVQGRRLCIPCEEVMD